MIDRLFNDSMYEFEKPQPSYWEDSDSESPESIVNANLRHGEDCDVAIIGGGYTGISAAYHLCEEYDLDVRVLEAGHIGWGASGRNGGFCSIGGHKLTDKALLRNFGLDATKQYYKSQVEAIELVAELIDKENIQCDCVGDVGIEIACSSKHFKSLKNHVDFQNKKLGLDSKLLEKEQIVEKYFDFPLNYGGVIASPTFGLHPLKFIRGLSKAVKKRGASLHSQCEVKKWQKTGDIHHLSGDWGTLKAKKVVIATNGFTPEFIHKNLDGITLPMISAIIVTRPLTATEMRIHKWQTDSPAITDLNLLDYFRMLPDGSFLFGGRGSSDGSPIESEKNFVRLRARFNTVFPGWADIEIKYQWHGLICLTSRLTPAIGSFVDDPSVVFGFGYHGNGVNTATWAGKQLARLLVTNRSYFNENPDWLPNIVYGMPQKFPFPKLRLKYVQASICMASLADKI